MANDINKTVVVGRLTKDMELAYTSGGLCIGKFSIAVNRDRKSGDEWVQDVSYFEVKCFGKIAENLKPYLTKGQQVVVDGFLKQERWEKDGEKNSKVTIGAENIQLVGGKKEGTQDNGGYGNSNGYGYGN